MRKGYVFLIIILLTSKVGISQWMWQNPEPHGYTLTALHFINPLTGWMCGIRGVVQKTTDRGATYHYQFIDTTQLTSIYFFNERVGFVAGPFGRIYRTVDGGSTYNIIRSNSNEVLFRLIFTDSLNGWSCGWLGGSGGGIILHTTDGGYQWTTQMNVSDGDVLGLSFINTNTGFACTNQSGKILKTTNSGQNWTEVYKNPSTNFWTINFVNQNVGFAAGFGGVLVRTTDGGSNWQLITSNLFKYYIFDIKFLNENTGFLSTSGFYYYYDPSLILKTTDKGTSWFPSYQSTEMGEFCLALFVNVSGMIRAVGDMGTSVVSYDNGVNWEREHFVTYADLRRVIFLDAQTGWAWGDYISSCDVLKTTDGGENWSVKFNSANKVGSIYFLTMNNGFYTNSAGEIFKTTDGGDNWVRIYQLANNYLADIYFIDSMTGWVCGDSGRVLRTTDGGQSWEYQSVGYNYWLIRIKFFDSNSGWVLANYSKIFRTTNGGQNWNAINLSSNFYFYSMSFPSDSVGFVGSDGWIYKTTNRGINWSAINLGSNSRCSSIDFNNNSTGYAFACGGNFYRTTNNGVNWQSIVLREIDFGCGDLFFLDHNTGWLAGSGGTILKTTNGGTVFITRSGEIIPSGYELFQNYPNPFNSVTRIKYTLPKSSSVKLEVYDILGRRIKLLVDGKQDRGSYEVIFLADELSSGVYFYRLEVDGRHIQTRKMILLK